jgi:hypothetical protein
MIKFFTILLILSSASSYAKKEIPAIPFNKASQTKISIIFEFYELQNDNTLFYVNFTDGCNKSHKKTVHKAESIEYIYETDGLKECLRPLINWSILPVRNSLIQIYKPHGKYSIKIYSDTELVYEKITNVTDTSNEITNEELRRLSSLDYSIKYRNRGKAIFWPRNSFDEYTMIKYDENGFAFHLKY